MIRGHIAVILNCALTLLLLGGGGDLYLNLGVDALTEEDRIDEYHKRNYTWPLLSDHDADNYTYPPHKEKLTTKFNPDTPGWSKLMRRRINQIFRVDDLHDRYNAWLGIMSSALIAPNFTETGWGLIKAPQWLTDELMDSLHSNMATARNEPNVEVIEGQLPPLFIPQHALNRKVLETLLPWHEAWITSSPNKSPPTKLHGALAYGLRVYREGASLNMHVDKPETHVISCIFHVDHDEQWPLIIEDYQGNTNEVYLESGDMVFYESSKVLHGRPTTFRGKYYSSLFVHYFPSGWAYKKMKDEAHWSVPPDWSVEKSPMPDLIPIEVKGTSIKEEACEDKWCALQDSVKWFGPAKEGKVITTNYPEGYDLILPSNDDIHMNDEL